MTACKEVLRPTGSKACPDIPICTTFSLADTTDCYITALMNEAINIGGANINVFKLLGIHEQGQLVDLAKRGCPLSSGDAQGHNAGNVFNNNTCQWHSSLLGQAVLTSAFIGYDFGEIRLDNGRVRYGIDTNIRQHITTIKIQQHGDAVHRVTKARVERSEDKKVWYGVAIITIPDNGDENTIHFKHSSPARFWRIRPIQFNGIAMNTFWGVEKIQLIDFLATHLDNVQDELGFLESRDRDYASQSIRIKAYYPLVEVQTELTKFGIDFPSLQFDFSIGFDTAVSALGRPVVIGDIFEVPSEGQFSADLKLIRKYLEVTDVSWSTEGYTPSWTPSILRVIAQPMFASQETQDIVGDLAGFVDTTGLFNLDDEIYQDLGDVDKTIRAKAKDFVPEHGGDIADVEELTDEQIDAVKDKFPGIAKLNVIPTAKYQEDALPPNGLPFTEGPAFPDNPKDRDYHRLTFAKADIPTRLYRFSVKKNRWIYLETDRRFEFDERKPTLQRFLKDSASVSPSKVGK